jgi:hypothetical protein
MDKGLSQQWLDALSQNGVQTAYLARFDFKSETVFVWTGAYSIQPTATGDALLDGNTFDPIASGVPYDVGTNSYSEQGSDSFVFTLAIPADVPPELQAASIDSNEFLTRPATVWRAIMLTPAGLATPAAWAFRRIRSGSMDTLEFSTDSTQSVVKLTIESYISYISDASQSTWSDQQRFDPADTSQVYCSSIENGQPLAVSSSTKNSLGIYSRVFKTP